ncbi:MAG: hypothetical protein AAF518_21845 [Spirochaetota bacterium]
MKFLTLSFTSLYLSVAVLATGSLLAQKSKVYPTANLKAVSTGANVNIRTKDSLRSPKGIGKIKKGEKLSVIGVGRKQKVGRLGTHHWYHISYSPSFDHFFEGWIFGSFVKFTIAKNSVKVRRSSNPSSKVIATLRKGAVIKVLASKSKPNKFESVDTSTLQFKIRTRAGKVGWIQYMSVKK